MIPRRVSYLSLDIVRLLFMVPLYALISCASFYFWVGCSFFWPFILKSFVEPIDPYRTRSRRLRSNCAHRLFLSASHVFVWKWRRTEENIYKERPFQSSWSCCHSKGTAATTMVFSSWFYQMEAKCPPFWSPSSLSEFSYLMLRTVFTSCN